MVGELITLPLRATEVATRLWWRAAGQAMRLSSSAAGFVIERVSPVPTPSPAAPEPSAVSAQQPSPVEPLDVPRVTEPQPVPPIEEPTHVSEEPTLVEELAEPGAEDGAGAELHIREPWEGYRHMTAREVTARLRGASAAGTGRGPAV